MCTHTDTERKQRKARVRNILKSSEKNTIFDEYPVPKICPFDSAIWKHNSVNIIGLISSTSNSTLTKTFHLDINTLVLSGLWLAYTLQI